MQFDAISTIALTGYAPSGAVGLNTSGPTLYISGAAQMWEPVGGSITLPVSIANGGTGATTAAGARTNLVAAKSGANADITQLTVVSHAAGTGIAISGSIDSNNAIEVTDGVHDTSWASGGLLTVTGIACSGGITGGAILASAGLASNQLQNATPGTPISVGQAGGGDTSLQFVGLGVPLQSLMGFTNYPTQTTVGAAGAAAALPPTPTLYLQAKINGTIYVSPWYART